MLLDGNCIKQLQDLCPKLEAGCGNRYSVRLDSNGSKGGLHLVDNTGVDSLATFERSFFGQAHQIFNKLPQDLVQKGNDKGWCGVMKEGQRLLSKTHSSGDLKRKIKARKGEVISKKTKV